MFIDLNPPIDDGSPMIIYGYDSIAPMLELEGYQFTILLNEIGVVLFPCETEHRDAAQPGIHYATAFTWLRLISQ